MARAVRLKRKRDDENCSGGEDDKEAQATPSGSEGGMRRLRRKTGPESSWWSEEELEIPRALNMFALENVIGGVTKMESIIEKWRRVSEEMVLKRGV
jgi:hypothetical protein